MLHDFNQVNTERSLNGSDFAWLVFEAKIFERLHHPTTWEQIVESAFRLGTGVFAEAFGQVLERRTSAQCTLEAVGTAHENGHLFGILWVIGLEQDVTARGTVGLTEELHDLGQSVAGLLEVRTDEVALFRVEEGGFVYVGLHIAFAQNGGRERRFVFIGHEQAVAGFGVFPHRLDRTQLLFNGCGIFRRSLQRDACECDVASGILLVLGFVLVGVVVCLDVAVGDLNFRLIDGAEGLEHVVEVHFLVRTGVVVLALQ